MALVYPISQLYLCTELKNFILMDSTDCFLEILSAYQSSDSRLPSLSFGVLPSFWR